MSRRRSHSQRSAVQRDHPSIPSDFRPWTPRLSLLDPVADLSEAVRSDTPIGGPFLSEIEDGRVWYPSQVPTGYRSPRRISSAVARVEARPLRDPYRELPFTPSWQLAFRRPEGVIHCVRRHRRREVLFALGRQGKGSRAPRRRRDRYSDVRC